MVGLKAGEVVLLLSKDESYLLEVGQTSFHTKSGIINLNEVIGKDYGEKIRTHLGKEFTIAKPNLLDILQKRVKRMPQIIMPKDIGMILAYTGVQQGSLVVDAGCGSGYIAIFLANYIKPGKVITYEKNEHFIKLAEENIKRSGLEEYIKLKKKDILNGIDEKNVDLITLDMKNAEKVIKYAYEALKAGGWLVVYSPTIEEVIAINKKIKEKNFSKVKTIENIVREWKVEKTTRPKTIGLLHTGFLTFARKVG